MRRATKMCLAISLVLGCGGEGEEFVPRESELKNHCTHTIGWWKSHNVYAKGKKQIAWPISEDSVGCGDTWLNWLNMPPEGDAWLILAHQWIAAQLNWGVGAEMPPEVQNAIYMGAGYLNQCEVSDADREAALEYAAVLDAYNNGLMGALGCG